MKWLLLIPHVIILAVLWLAVWVVSVIAWFAIVFTGRYPKALFDFTVGVLRWTWRVAFYSYSALGTDRYPPFSLDADPEYPATLDIDVSRAPVPGPGVGEVLVVGHPAPVHRCDPAGWAAAGWEDGQGAGSPPLIGLLVFFAAVGLLFTGRYARGLFDLIMGLNRWVVRVAAYVLLLRDEYPPFRLDQGGDEPPP